MSDDLLTIVPRDPTHVPLLSTQRQLEAALRRLAPESDEVVSESFDQISFFDAGSNFERVACPQCAADLDLSWWQDRMDEDWRSGGFALAPYAMPCCQGQATLNELVYDWPQAFGRFRCTAINAGIGELSVEQKTELERVVGVPLLIVRRHL